MSSLRFPSALAAVAPPLWRKAFGVSRVFMPLRAVRCCALFGHASSDGFNRDTTIDVALRCEHTNKAQAALSSLLNRVALQVGRFVSQIGQFVRDALYGEPHSPSLVSLLLFACCPPTIHRGVVGVVVDPVERRSFRTAAHVFCELSVGVPPLSAHSDASTSVVGKLLGGWRVAAPKHALPHGVKRRDVFERHAVR